MSKRFVGKSGKTSLRQINPQSRPTNLNLVDWQTRRQVMVMT